MKVRRRFSIVERRDIVDKSQACLWSTDGTPGREYLLGLRQLSEPTMRAFGLGYIPDYVRHQLSGRIIMPIYDPSNNLIAISSRLVNEGQSVLPIYWHESYEKSFYLYGMHIAKNKIRQIGFVIIVEGQFDVLQLHNHGVTNVSALCGTKLSEIQYSTITRYGEKIILLLDTDVNQSGQKATTKILAQFNSPYVRAITFDQNIDPDKFVRSYGIETLKGLVMKTIQATEVP